MSELTRAQREFRAAMANLSAAVNVVTTDGPFGRAGMTVSAACSVTDDPPTFLVCVNRSSSSHGVLMANERICLNVLRADQEKLAMRFAGATDVPNAERFSEGSWDLESEGTPVLRDALAWVTGHIVFAQTLGSHSVVFAAVDQVMASPDYGALVYFQRQFHSLATPSLSA